MSGIRTASTPRPWTGAALVALLVALLIAGACGAPKVTKRQTDIMEKAGTVSVSAAVLRVGVNDLVDRFAGRLEQSADRIVKETDTVAIRQRALALKANAIPMVYTAGYRADPLSAAVDVWVLAFQFREYAGSAAGLAAFGPQQRVLQETAREQLADVDTVMRTIAIRPEHFDRARPQVEQWAATHPLEQALAGRQSGASLLTSLRSADQDVFVVVGTVADTLENLSERLNTYAAQLPKQARWQAELLASQMTTGLKLEQAVDDFHDVATTARHASGVLDSIPALIDIERNILADERRPCSRASTASAADPGRPAGYVTGSASRSWRRSATSAWRRLRPSTRSAWKRPPLSKRCELTVDSSLVGLRELVDYTIWRVAMLVALLMLLAAVLGVVAVRLTSGHGRGEWSRMGTTAAHS